MSEQTNVVPDGFYKPIAFHFLVMPHVPNSEGTFLDKNEQPVSTNYNTVDWAALGKAATDLVNEHSIKGIKVYVANDGPDLFDMHNIDTSTGGIEESKGDFYSRSVAALEHVSMKNLRGGLLKLSEESQQAMHINPIKGQDRPPLTGVWMTIKFQNFTQVIDYMALVTDVLFGIHGHPQMADSYLWSNPADPKDLAPCIHEWFEQQFGAVYSTKHTLLYLGRNQ